MSRIQSRFQPKKASESAFIAKGAIVVGDVTIGARASVWFNAVLRGDTEALTIGDETNIQDGAVCHADPGLPLFIGEGVTVGHRAIVHGARIGNHSLIGMGSIVLNGASIGKNCLIGAGALVTQRMSVPDGMLLLGSPAKAIRPVTVEEIAMIRRTAANYVDRARAFKRSA